MPRDSERAARLGIFAALATIPVAHQAGVDLILISPIIALLPVAGIVLDSRRALRVTSADLRLIEHPTDSEVCLVRVSIYSGECQIGTDRGLCWITGDRLHFVGHATSFVLGGQDIVPTSERPSAPNTVALRHSIQDTSLIIVPLHQWGEIGSMRRACFFHRFETFRAGASPTLGARQWPPVQPWSGVK